jgi:dihydrofolate reductase
MRRLRIFEHISLDGVIQVRGAGEDSDFPYGDWTAPYRSPAGRDLILAAYGERFDLLLGRRTYDLWSGFWPKASSSPMSDRLNAATKYIATHRPESLEWGPFEGFGPDISEGTPPRSFELASTKALPSGIVINAYRGAGPLKNQP